MGNRLEFVEIDFAIARAGKVKVPINPRLTDAERQLHPLELRGRRAVHRTVERERVESIRSELPDLEHVVVVDEPDSYGDLLASASALRPSVAIDPDDPSMILHTSGTTGRPKGATTSQRARVSSALNMLLDEFSADERRRHGARRPDVARVRIEDPRLLHARCPEHHPRQVRSRLVFRGGVVFGGDEHVRRADDDPDAAGLPALHARQLWRASATSPTGERPCPSRSPKRR